MSITQYYGGSSLAMMSKSAIVITADKRFGNQASTLHSNFTRLYQMTDKIILSLTGFVPDCQILFKTLRKHVNMFQLNQQREIEPKEFTSLLSYILYSRRFMPYLVSPLIAGFDRNNSPHVYTMDLIGCVSTHKDFASTGTAANNLTGISDVLYTGGDVEDEDLFVTTMQAFLNAIDRNALSGWGADAIILTPHKRIHREVKTRQD
ncbi:20S proteasome subunit beta 3 [Nematocida minor]|uniref:20S proteasome subunit beta 3 n=1 Tax=Nematocida minor TaxID=1912983 RepID=UPI00221F0D9B|nr:20S proteasome subunit beta 3 [Nematocida minor]KAI5192687.1 20S proteasome subunit beta 3 [Nematocida minor]